MWCKEFVPFLLIRNVCVESTMTLRGSQHHLSCTLRWVGGSHISNAVEKRKLRETHTLTTDISKRNLEMVMI